MVGYLAFDYRLFNRVRVGQATTEGMGEEGPEGAGRSGVIMAVSEFLFWRHLSSAKAKIINVVAPEQSSDEMPRYP